MDSIPMKKRKRDGRQITAWIDPDDLETLKKANVNVTELVRKAIKEASDLIRSRSSGGAGDH